MTVTLESSKNAGRVLPNAPWRETTLGQVISASTEKVDPLDRPDAPYIGLEHIERDVGVINGQGKASDVRSTKSVFRKGDLLYGKLRPYLNKVWVAQFDGVCSTDILVFPRNDSIDASFLKYRFMTSDFVGFASEHSNGVNLPRVNAKALARFPLKLPPLPEQRRVVAEIEQQFTRLDAGVTALRRVQANLKRYRAAVLKIASEGHLVPTEAELHRGSGVTPLGSKNKRQDAASTYETGEHLLARILTDRRKNWSGRGKYKEPAAPDTTNLPTLPDGWTWASVEQLAAPEPNSITDGPFGSNLKTDHYTDNGPRVLRLQNIGDGVYVDAVAHISQAHFERLQKHRIFENDVVIAGFGENPPRSCIIPAFLGPAIVKADCIRFKPHRSVLPQYMNASLNSDPVRKRMKGLVHGIGRPRLNLGEIKSIIVPLPPLAEQTRIVAEVECRLSVVDELESVATANLQRATCLRQSVLQQAFAPSNSKSSISSQ